MMAHGERRTYNAGCHCDACTAADRDYQQCRRPEPALRVALAHSPVPGRWAERGRCRTESTELFFPGKGVDASLAKQVCGLCPVLAECRAYALAAPNALVGVWGAMSARERVYAKRALKAAS